MTVADLWKPPPFPALVIYVAVLVLVFGFSLVIIALQRELASVKLSGDRRQTVGRRISDGLLALIHPITGADGRVSFSKLISVAVLAHYAVSANLPAVVACWIIAASFGAKILLAVIDKTGLTVSSATSLMGSAAKSFTRTESDATSTAHSDVTIHTIEEKRIVDERGPTGEPPVSLPPDPAARTVDGGQ
jgi:hypothetical protein